jgi:pyrimidine operon attenuation protein/uracil phosphoribosyltransferase
MEPCFSVIWVYFSRMSKIEEIEHAVEQLPLNDFIQLAVWVDRRRQQLEISQPTVGKSPPVVRDHSAFLNSYAPQDEGLYDDAAAR